MDLNDDDFCYVEEEEDNPDGDTPEKVNKLGHKLRGPDLSWVELKRFENANDYRNSEVAKELAKEYSLRKRREYGWADVLEYECKFKRRVGFQQCPMKMKVAYLAHNTQVTVETLENVNEHKHEEDDDFVNNKSKYFKWTPEAEKIVKEAVKCHATPKLTMRHLKAANIFPLPSNTELYNKRAALKKKAFPSTKVKNTHELRLKVAKYLEEPASENEAFIPFHTIDDEDDSKDPRFLIIFTTRKNMSKLRSDSVLQTDATYRLDWDGFPVFVVGTSTSTGRFFASCAILSSHEDSEAWTQIYQFVKDLNVLPRYQLGDGAKAITNAGNNVFSDIPFSRLMCWAHVHTNCVRHLKSVAALNKTVHNNILQDIVDLQWSVLNEETFRLVFDLLEKKYQEKYDDALNSVILKFFEYMRKVWIQSNEFRWYEGAHPWGVSNNQGVEGKNMDIKLNYTFRRQLEVGELFDVMLVMVSEWSDEDTTPLESPRLAALHGQKDSLALKTKGYHQYQKMKRNPKDWILKIKNPKDKYTVSESSEFQLGEVSTLWAVRSSSGSTADQPLKDLAINRILNRKVPKVTSFDDYMKTRSSCWIVEERQGDYFCDCPIGMKGKLCKETSGLLYYKGEMEITSDVRSIPLGSKRKPGRPKKLPHPLTKSPLQARPQLDEVPDVLSGPPAGAVHDDLDLDLEAQALPKKTSRKRKRIEDIESSDSPQLDEVSDVLSGPPAGAGHDDFDLDLDAQAFPKKTSRKKKRFEDIEISDSPIAIIRGQRRVLEAGLGPSKPSKKAKQMPSVSNKAKANLPKPTSRVNRMPAASIHIETNQTIPASNRTKPALNRTKPASNPTKPASNQTKSASTQAKPSSIQTMSSDSSPKLPPQIVCKKRKDSCNHEIVFSKHYDKKLWSKYAAHIRSKKSTVEIDPNYFA